ncbi:MAG TPA: hypothetical protein VIL46_06935, partial [Gemmataceae bacterium]
MATSPPAALRMSRPGWAGALLALLFAAAPAPAQQAAPEDGLFVTVPNPITGEAVNRIRSVVDQAVNR